MESFSSYPKCQKCGGYTDPKWDHIIGCCVCEIDAWEPLFPPPKELIGYVPDGSGGTIIVDIHPDMSVVYLPTSIQSEAKVSSLPEESLAIRLSPKPEENALRKNRSSPFTNPKKTVLKFIKKDWEYLVTAFGQKSSFSLGIFYSRFGDWWSETYGTTKASPKIFTIIEVHDVLSSLVRLEGFPKKGWTYTEKLFYRLPIPSSVPSVVSATEEPLWNKYRGKRIAFVQELEREDSDDLSHGVLYGDTDSMFIERLPEDTTPKYKALKEVVKGRSGDIPSLIYPKGKPS